MKNIEDFCLNIAFIVPKPIKGSGGHRNIYRAIDFLRRKHKVSIYYTETKENPEIVKQQICDYFVDISNVSVFRYEGELNEHDVAIATWWKTAFAIEDNIEKIKFPFYFVQDYEPFFYPMSSNAILAENTYKLGFMHICSGPWCRDFLIEKYNAKAKYFQFPINRDVYHKRDIGYSVVKSKKKIIFFAKPEMPRRCFELGLAGLKELLKINKNVEIYFWGSENIENIPNIINLGLLPTLNDLAELYRSADLGIVFSTTNPSLVPYEMMACGCPVVDLDTQNAIAKYGYSDQNVFLVNPRARIMAEQLNKIINNNQLRNDVANSAYKWVDKEFPSEEEMGKLVEKIIIDTINENSYNL